MKQLFIILLVLNAAGFILPEIKSGSEAISTTSVNSFGDTLKKPSLKLEEDTLSPMSILVIRDTAKTTAAIGSILSKRYSELFTYINQNDLFPGKMMAFYYTSKLPFIMETGIEIDKLPNQTTGRIKINKVAGGHFLIAHYKGPYEQIVIAYTAISVWLKEHTILSAGAPFEVYLNSLDMVNDLFELRTDIYQPLK